MKKNAYIFIGRSGSGKSTQAHLLASFIREKGEEILHVESGDLFREFIEGSSYSSKLASEIQETGKLQPPFLAVHMWAHLLLEGIHEKTSVLFDGSPRYLEEARLLKSALSFYRMENVYIFFIDVKREWSQERLIGRGRSDDRNLEVIQRRLNWFDDTVSDVVKLLQNEPSFIFCHINGEQSIEDVAKEISSHIKTE